MTIKGLIALLVVKTHEMFDQEVTWSLQASYYCD